MRTTCPLRSTTLISVCGPARPVTRCFTRPMPHCTTMSRSPRSSLLTPTRSRSYGSTGGTSSTMIPTTTRISPVRARTPASTWRRGVRSDHETGSSASRIEPANVPGNEPHRGCNCGRRRSAPAVTPLLTHDLVIAARDRAREPELPEATLERALSTPISPRLARYDVIVVSDAPGDDRATRIAAEFARHEHRVFHIGEHDPRQRPAAPTLSRIDGRSDSLLDTLSALRQSEAIEAAVLFTPASLDARIV